MQVKPEGLLHKNVNHNCKEFRRDNIVITGLNPKQQWQKYGSHGVHQNTIRSVHTICLTFVLLIVLAAVNHDRESQEMTIVCEQENYIEVCNCSTFKNCKQKIKHNEELDYEKSFHLAHPFLYLCVICKAEVHEVHHHQALQHNPPLSCSISKAFFVVFKRHSSKWFISIQVCAIRSSLVIKRVFKYCFHTKFIIKNIFTKILI